MARKDGPMGAQNDTPISDLPRVFVINGEEHPDPMPDEADVRQVIEQFRRTFPAAQRAAVTSYTTPERVVYEIEMAAGIGVKGGDGPTYAAIVAALERLPGVNLALLDLAGELLVGGEVDLDAALARRAEIEAATTDARRYIGNVAEFRRGVERALA